eukprot:GDKH01003862.1.p2 GENE.GDKH01003862.1~~GDKH01003862.1.p2  ORF type:complete len:97 (+),score=8.57 GDKH01003862.1:150-440(+)
MSPSFALSLCSFLLAVTFGRRRTSLVAWTARHGDAVLKDQGRLHACAKGVVAWCAALRCVVERRLASLVQVACVDGLKEMRPMWDSESECRRRGAR